MNYFKLASLLFAVTFLFNASYASQVAMTHAKQVEPIEFDIDDNLFVIHPAAIHIYNKYEVFLAPGEPLREEILTERRSVACVVGFARIGTIYDKYNFNKKLTGEAYKNALATMQDSFWLANIIENSFASPFKEIVQNNNLALNDIPVGHNLTYLALAILKGSKPIVETLIQHGADINLISDQRTPLLIAICCVDTQRNTEIVKTLLVAGANIQQKSEGYWAETIKYIMPRPNVQKTVSEIYFAREVKQMQLMHKKFLSKGANVKELADEIIEYLLGKNHKVMSMSACRKALENR